MLPLLSSALEYGGAPAHAVGSLMVIGAMLEGEEFTKRVVPTLSKLFASPGEKRGTEKGPRSCERNGCIKAGISLRKR